MIKMLFDLHYKAFHDKYWINRDKLLDRIMNNNSIVAYFRSNNNDNKRNENIIGKITNRALIINSSNFNLFKVERIKHIKYKINTKGRG